MLPLVCIFLLFCTAYLVYTDLPSSGSVRHPLNGLEAAIKESNGGTLQTTRATLLKNTPELANAAVEENVETFSNTARHVFPDMFFNQTMVPNVSHARPYFVISSE